MSVYISHCLSEILKKKPEEKNSFKSFTLCIKLKMKKQVDTKSYPTHRPTTNIISAMSIHRCTWWWCGSPSETCGHFHLWYRSIFLMLVKFQGISRFLQEASMVGKILHKVHWMNETCVKMLWYRSRLFEWGLPLDCPSKEDLNICTI